jgi:hypothetical protein
MLEPDADQIEIFTDALFRHCGSGFVSLRVFPGDGSTKPALIRGVPVVGRDLHALNAAALEVAGIAARRRDRATFAPPIATFSDRYHAREIDLADGPTISVEIDERPWEALCALVEVLGRPTVLVSSGGRWVDPETGIEFLKLHTHYRLTRPARGQEQLRKLKRARAVACELADADPTSNAVCHGLRWPGSLHLKSTPRLCRIVELHADVEVDLDQALQRLEAAVPPKPPKPVYVPPRRIKRMSGAFYENRYTEHHAGRPAAPPPRQDAPVHEFHHSSTLEQGAPIYIPEAAAPLEPDHGDTGGARQAPPRAEAGRAKHAATATAHSSRTSRGCSSRCSKKRMLRRRCATSS